MALTQNTKTNRYVDQQLRTVPTQAGAHIFKGALLEWSPTGFVRPLTGTGLFAGIAYEEIDNTAGEDADAHVRLFTIGDFEFTFPAALPQDVNRPVYATDDHTLTFSSTGATLVGYLQQHVGPGSIILRLPGRPTPTPQRIEHHSQSRTLSLASSDAVLTNLGAAAAITMTLPQNPPSGTALKFVCMADAQLRIQPGPGAAIYVKGIKQADNKYVAIADIGHFIHLVADGNGDWIAVASIAGTDAGITVEA